LVITRGSLLPSFDTSRRLESHGSVDCYYYSTKKYPPKRDISRTTDIDPVKIPKTIAGMPVHELGTAGVNRPLFDEELAVSAPNKC
jgi:hypothetical protein